MRSANSLTVYRSCLGPTRDDDGRRVRPVLWPPAALRRGAHEGARLQFREFFRSPWPPTTWSGGQDGVMENNHGFGVPLAPLIDQFLS